MIEAEDDEVKRGRAIAAMAGALRDHFGDDASSVARDQMESSRDSVAGAAWQAILIYLAAAPA